MFGLRPRETAGPTLGTELAKLEEQARTRLEIAPATYSRALLAADTGIAQKSLNDWLSGAHRPRDFESLLKVVRALSTFAGQDTVDESFWRGLHVDAGRRGGGGNGGAPDRKRRRRWIAVVGGLGLTAIGAVITTIVSGVFSPVGPAIASHIFPTSAGSSSQSSTAVPAETLQASAYWCCQLVQVLDHGGYYWQGDVTGMTNEMLAKAAYQDPKLVPAGSNIIEIPLQTSGDENIYVGPPQVEVLSRKTNVTGGIIGIIPLGGQGGGQLSQYQTSLDAAKPETVSIINSGSTKQLSTAPAYVYVSSGTSALMLLTVTDSGCDCTFDIKLTWRAQGKQYSETIENGSQPFHMIGSSGVPWYTGWPQEKQAFKAVTGNTFPAN
jgi:hypothetical protein